MKIKRIEVLRSTVTLAVLVWSCGAGDGQIETPSFSEHIIDDNARGTASIHACDLDNDGDVDILGAVLEENAVVYWRNDGGIPIVWSKQIIDGGFQGAISVYAADLDGDGDEDVLGASAGGNEIAVWRNDGGDPIAWTKQIVVEEFTFAHEVYAHDLDSDGDNDILAASTQLNAIAWWRNDGGAPLAWTMQTIDSSFSQAKSVRVADFDGDGYQDIVGAALEANEVAWWRSNGNDPTQWTKYTIAGDLEGAHRVQAVDIDGDGDADVLAAAYGARVQPEDGLSPYGHMVAWWRNDGGSPVSWTRQVIGKNFPRACIAQAADMDGDNDIDVVATAQDGNEVALWLNNGSDPVNWTKLTVADLTRVWPLYVIDLDADGDQDVIAGSGWKGINAVKWWENQAKQ
jgi:hypothetical protein